MTNLNDLRDEALRIAVEHGFKDATIGEDTALMHSELSEALEDHRAGKGPTDVWYEEKNSQSAAPYEGSVTIVTTVTRYDRQRHDGPLRKPCGIPSEMADVIIRALHFCGKHGIDIDAAVREKMAYNDSRPFKHGGKAI